MSPDLLNILLTADPAALPALIQSHALTAEAVLALKEHSARFYATEPAQAGRVAQRALELGLLLPPPAAAYGRWTLANAYIYQDRYAEANALYSDARAELLALGETLDAARLAVGQVGTLAHLGQPRAGLALAAEYAPLLQAASQSNPADRGRWANLLMNQGVCHDLLGEYEEALVSYQQLSALAEELGNQLLLASAKQNQAYALTQLNAFVEALRYYRQAEEIFLTAGAVWELTRLYMNKSILLAAAYQPAAALAALAQSDEQLVRLEGVDLQRHYLTNVRIALQLQTDTPALPELTTAVNAALAAFVDHGPVYQEGLSRFYLGHIYARQQQWELAAASFAQVQQLAAAGAGRFLASLALAAMGDLHRDQQQWEPAIQSYRTAIEQIEAVRAPLRTDRLRTTFLTDKLGVYHELALLHAQQGQLPTAFAMVEQARARLLAEKLDFRLGNAVAPLIHAADETVAHLAQQLAATLAELETAEQQLRSSQTDELTPIANLATSIAQQTVERLEGRVPGLVQALQQHEPSFAPFSQPQPVAFAALQAQLTDTTLLQFFVVRGTLWLLLANAAGVYRHLRLGPLAPVQAAHNALHVAINRTLELCKSRGLVTTLPYLPVLLADVNRQLATLYNLLLAPAADQLPPDHALLILPTDLLYYIPFHALYTGSRYLLEERVVSYAPSATVLHLCARHTATLAAAAGTAWSPAVLLFGYGGEQLPQVPAELARLAHCLPQAQSWGEAEATTAEFLNQAPAHDLIHLAAHAHFRTDRPELSALTLADRRLTLAEIARLRLRARLVTLSGCDTGRGQLQGGELLTLAAGFLGAGASALVTSLWRVEDQATAQLMEHFYQGLLAGLPCAQALQQAQLTLLRRACQPHTTTPWHAHPAFWAPFTVLGDGQVRLS